MKQSKKKSQPTMKMQSPIQQPQIKIHPFQGNAGLAEIYQSVDLKMALLHEIGPNEYQQITPKVKCRDFLCDVYSSTVQKTDFHIYGMTWEGSCKTPDWDKVKLLVQFPSDVVFKLFQESWILKHIEKTNKLSVSEVVGLDNNQVVIFADKWWLTNVLTLSLYTFLLRAMCHPYKTEDWLTELSKNGTTDGVYAAYVPRASWDKVLADLWLLETKDWNGLDYSVNGTSNVHHNSGFISVFGNHSEKYENTVRKNRHWQEMKSRGFDLYTT